MRRWEQIVLLVLEQQSPAFNNLPTSCLLIHSDSRLAGSTSENLSGPMLLRRLGGVVVRASDLWSRDREFDSRLVHCRVAQVNSAFHPSGVGKSSTSLLAAVKAGRVFTCVRWQVTLCDPMWQVTPCSAVTGLISWRAIRSFNLFKL